MTGARGVLQTCSTIVEMIQARNILDIGLFTGVSALTWATITPSDGKIISMDVDAESYNTIGKSFIDNVSKIVTPDCDFTRFITFTHFLNVVWRRTQN